VNITLSTHCKILVSSPQLLLSVFVNLPTFPELLQLRPIPLWTDEAGVYGTGGPPCQPNKSLKALN